MVGRSFAVIGRSTGEEGSTVYVVPRGDRPLRAVGTSHGPGGVRYVEAVEMPDGTTRFFFEHTKADGSRDLRAARTVGV